MEKVHAIYAWIYRYLLGAGADYRSFSQWRKEMAASRRDAIPTCGDGKTRVNNDNQCIFGSPSTCQTKDQYNDASNGLNCVNVHSDRARAGYGNRLHNPGRTDLYDDSCRT